MSCASPTRVSGTTAAARSRGSIGALRRLPSAPWLGGWGCGRRGSLSGYAGGHQYGRGLGAQRRPVAAAFARGPRDIQTGDDGRAVGAGRRWVEDDDADGHALQKLEQLLLALAQLGLACFRDSPAAIEVVMQLETSRKLQVAALLEGRHRRAEDDDEQRAGH